MQQVAYRYDGTFAGFLTCVYESYVNHEPPAAFLLSGDSLTLWEEREVDADEGKAKRVYARLKRVSPAFQKLIARGFLTCLPNRELDLYTLIRRGLAEGDRVRKDLSDPVMARVNLALTKMWTEWDHLKGFVRFSELDGVLVGEIEPKNRVLPLLAPHFADRFSGEQFILYDRTHREAIFYVNYNWAILPMEEFSMGGAGEEEKAFRDLWRRYFKTISIEGRFNPKCQTTHLPKRYRHEMTEFVTDEEMETAPTGQAMEAYGPGEKNKDMGRAKALNEGGKHHV